jgi:hypothetical protein
MSIILVAVTFLALWLVFGWPFALVGITGGLAWSFFQRRPGHIVRIPPAEIVRFPNRGTRPTEARKPRARMAAEEPSEGPAAS